MIFNAKAQRFKDAKKQIFFFVCAVCGFASLR